MTDVDPPSSNATWDAPKEPPGSRASPPLADLITLLAGIAVRDHLELVQKSIGHGPDQRGP